MMRHWLWTFGGLLLILVLLVGMAAVMLPGCASQTTAKIASTDSVSGDAALSGSGNTAGSGNTINDPLPARIMAVSQSLAPYATWLLYPLIWRPTAKRLWRDKHSERVTIIRRTPPNQG